MTRALMALVTLLGAPQMTYAQEPMKKLAAGAESAFRRVAQTLRWQDRTSVRIDPGDGWVTTTIE